MITSLISFSHLLSGGGARPLWLSQYVLSLSLSHSRLRSLTIRVIRLSEVPAELLRWTIRQCYFARSLISWWCTVVCCIVQTRHRCAVNVNAGFLEHRLPYINLSARHRRNDDRRKFKDDEIPAGWTGLIDHSLSTLNKP